MPVARMNEQFQAMQRSSSIRQDRFERTYFDIDQVAQFAGIGNSAFDALSALDFDKYGEAITHQEGCSCGECMAGGAAKQSGDSPTFAPDLVPGDTTTGLTIAVGGSVDVAIDTVGDRDWYKVELTAGVTYTIQTSFDGSGTDAFLNLRNSTGTVVLASDDDSGNGVNSLISFTATTTGTHYIDAGTYNNETTGSYHLFVAAAAPAGDFVNGTISSTTTLAVAGTTNGNIDSSGDHDFYRIELVAGQTYVFRTAGISATDTSDTVLTLRDASGAQLGTNDDSGEAGFSAIRYTAATTGTYFLDVSGFGTTTGTFNLTAFVAQPLTLFTNDQIATQLTNTYWGGTSRRFNVTAGGTLTYNITALTAEGTFLAREALNLWSDVLGITFSEVSTGGQIVFDDNQDGAFANSTRVGGFITLSNVNVSTSWLSSYGTTLQTYSFQTYIHEIGHALGLGHAGNYNGNAGYADDANYLNDSWATTIMSYFDQVENTYFNDQGFTRQFVVSPVVADAIAVNNLYGTATTTRTGNTTYGFNNNSGRAIYTAVAGQTAMTYTVVDHGGTDTLDYSGYTAGQRIDLNPEAFSNVGGRVGNVTIARGSVIENAIGGSGTDVLIGNSAANTLDGGAGISTLNGGGGNDRLILRASANGSTIDGGANTDTLVINNTVTSLAGFAGLEALEFAAGAILTLTGTQFANGLASNSALSGTGTLTVNMTAGVNFLASGMSFTSTVGTVVNGTSGIDIIKLGLGASTGNTINSGDGVDQIRGSNGVDTINGGIGNDKIMGIGGADVLTGGTGNDQFRYFQQSDSGLGRLQTGLQTLPSAETS
jgi:serralysin